MRALRHLLIVLPLATSLAACTDNSFEYTAQREAPDPDEYSEDGGDVSPNRDDAFVELELDSGAQVVIWIDPDDIREVVVQHSDPSDDGAWTEPRRIFRAGDGCLDVGAGTDGTTVAVALGCYDEDAFEQQAPDRGVALVTTDLVDWEVDDELGEFSCDEPEVEDGEVTFVNDIYRDSGYTWSEEDGFTSFED